MIAAVLASQLSKKKRIIKRKNTEKKTNIEKNKSSTLSIYLKFTV